jgi:hypothetical protein
MRIPIWILVLSITSFAQTLGVKPITPINISSDQALAITARVQETATLYCETVDRNAGLQGILEEHGLRMAGATQTPDAELNLTSATQIISGSSGSSGLNQWFINLSLSDVESGKVLSSQHATVSSYKDLLTISKTVTKALLMKTRIEDDDQVTTSPDNQPIIIGTDKVIVETHVYQHAPGTHNKLRFVACQRCGGYGKVPCRGSEYCPHDGQKDCPNCNINSMYNNLTGHWEK